MPPELVTLLVMYLLRSEEVRQAAIERVESKDFAAQEERDHRLLWDIVQELCATGFGQFVKRDFILAEVLRKTVGHPDYPISENIQAALNFVTATYATDMEFAPEYGKRLLQMFLDERQVLDPLRRGLFGGGEVPLTDLLTSFGASYSKTRVQTAEILRPMMPGQELFGSSPRNPTGISFIDELLGGGMMPAAVYGLLGPSSGGKTTLGLQILATYAMTKRHILFASYESAVRGELQDRICAAVTGLSTKCFEGRKYEQLEPSVQQKLRLCQATCAKYLHVVDMSGRASNGQRVGSGGAEELATLVRDLTQQGEKPELLIVDWLWPMMLRYVGARGEDEAQARVYVTSQMDKFCNMASEYGINVWINHMLDAASTKKKAGATLSFTGSAEAKNFAWLLSGCFALSAIDIKDPRKHPIVTLTISKSRSQRASYRFIELHGELCSFKDVSDQVELDERSDDIVDKGESNSVPTGHGQNPHERAVDSFMDMKKEEDAATKQREEDGLNEPGEEALYRARATRIES